MGDDLPVVWRAEPHTRAKHAILQGYLNAWFPILTRQSRYVSGASRRILFIDGFAGPGEYQNSMLGSPAIALETALNHDVQFPVPAQFLFIEQDAERFKHLQEVLDRFSERISESKNVSLTQPRQGECQAVLTELLDKHEQQGMPFGPALAFLDQFGYSDVPMELIKRILAHPQCEVLSYLDYKGMNRWISDSAKSPAFTRTFGGDEWTEAVNLPAPERRAFLWKAYKQALGNRAKVKYISRFTMFDKNNQPLYWLVFCSNNLRGLEVMKRAMWKVDETGSFQFSDKEAPGQLRLLSQEFDQDWLATELEARLAGKQLTASEVKEYVLAETPCYLFKRALEILETDREPRLQVLAGPEKRRRGTFPDKHLETIVIRFHSRLF